MLNLPNDGLGAADFARPEGPVGRQLANLMYESNESMIFHAADVLAIQPDDQLLEIGQASGQHLFELMQRYEGVTYTGVEHAHTMHHLCLNNEALTQFNCQFIKVAAYSYLLPFTDNQFEKILTVNVIYFYSRIMAALQEYRRVLKPGGCVAIAFKDIRTLVTAPLDFTGMIMYEPYTIRELLVETGFVDIEVSSYYEHSPRADGHHNECCYHVVKAYNSDRSN